MSSILTVKKKNKEMKIMETQKAEFLALGFSVIDENGVITETGSAITIGDMKSLNETIKAENKKLKSEIKKLKAENEKLKADQDKA